MCSSLTRTLDRQIESIKVFLSAVQPKNKAALLFITNDAPFLLQKLPSASSEVQVYQDRDFGLRDAFGAPRCCEKWQLYNGSGQLSATGDFDSGDGASQLRSLIDGEGAYSSSVLLGVLKALHAQGRFQRFNTGARPERKAMVVMLHSVCTGCGSGSLVEALNTYAARDHDISYVAVVPNSFKGIDIINLKTNLGLSFAVVPANDSLSWEWQRLEKQYGERMINGSVIALDDDQPIGVADDMESTARLRETLRNR